MTVPKSLRESVVLANRNSAGQSQLVAYVVPGEEGEITSARLRQYLSQLLPAYMVPARFVTLASLPLTPNGKLDRRALAELDDSDPTPTLLTYAAPRSAMETMLVGIWQEVLKLERVGIHDNFFELGGHSLMAVRLFALIEKTLGPRLPLALLFKAPTVAQLAVLLQRDGAHARGLSASCVRGSESCPIVAAAPPVTKRQRGPDEQ